MIKEKKKGEEREFSARYEEIRTRGPTIKKT